MARSEKTGPSRRFLELLTLATALLQYEKRISYRALGRIFDLDDACLEDLKFELVHVKRLAVEQDGEVLVWVERPEITAPLVPGPEPVLPRADHRPEPLPPPAARQIARDGPRANERPELAPPPAARQIAPAVRRVNEGPAPTPPPRETAPARAAATPAQAPQPAPPSADITSAQGERRLLTVMFVDLVGSTELSTRFDPEDLGELIRGYQKTCANVIAQFDGFICQYLGDGIVAYFGYPKAHENDAERAVLTGLAIIEAMADFEPTIEVAKDLKLDVRIGIDTGLVVVGEIIGEGSAEQATVVGETPNIAARLQALAQPNTMVIGKVTYELIAAAVTCEDLGSHQLKGIPEPVHAWRVVGRAEAEHEVEETGLVGGFPLVGRDEEIGLLTRRWDQSKESIGQVVLITGEAGIGKSTLVETVGAQVKKEGFTRITFRFSPFYINTALYPLIEHIKRVSRWQAGDTTYTKMAKLEQMLATYDLSVEEVMPLFAALVSLPLPAERYPPLDLTPQEQKLRTLDALVAWTLDEAERRPTFQLWDDLHWADPTTLELLGLLMDQARTASLLIALTFRPEFVPPWPTRSHMTPITLNRLEGPHIEAIVTRLARGKVLPTEVVQHIVNKTDGIPLYVEELTKLILESGLLREEADRFDLTGPLSAVKIPATLQESLMARLDRLPKLREVAQLGAVLGREFSYEMLSALAPIDEANLQDGLSQLVEAELLYQRGRPPRAKYVFKHALIQDAAYQSLLKRTRQQYHRQVANLLETRFLETVETQPELLAHHHTEAGSNQLAVEYWLKAGQQAVHRSADREAVGHFEKGLNVLLTLPDTPERARRELILQTSLGPALMATKGYAAPTVGKAYRRARDLCQQLKDITQLFPVLWGLWMYHMVRAEHEAASELTKQILGLAQTTGDPDLALEAQFAAGLSAFYRADLLAAREHLEQAINAYDPERHRALALTFGGLDPAVCCLDYLAWTLWLLGYPDQALKRADEAQPLAKRVANLYTQARSLYWDSLLRQFTGQWDVLRERIDLAIAMATEHGFALVLGVGPIMQGWALSMEGRAEEGLRQITQGLERYQATGAGFQLPHLMTALIETYKKLEQPEEGLAAVAEAQALVEKTGERYYEAELQRLKGELLLAQSPNKPAEAETCFQNALDIARRQHAKSLELRAVMSLFRLRQRQGKDDDARQLLSDIFGWFTEGFDSADLRDARALLDELGTTNELGLSGHQAAE